MITLQISWQLLMPTGYVRSVKRYSIHAVTMLRRSMLKLLTNDSIKELKMLSKANELFYKNEQRPEIVCLCGSTRFVDQFNEQRKILTEEGKIILSIELVTTQAKDEDPQHVNPDLKIRLDELHKRKIDLADSVIVINRFGYIGKSTASEIEHACKIGKPIHYLYNTYPAEVARVQERLQYYRGQPDHEEIVAAIELVLEQAEVADSDEEMFAAYAAMEDIED